MKIVAGVTAVLALAALASAAVVLARERDFARDRPPPGRVIEVGGARVHAVERGAAGPAVVLLHGNPGTALDFEGVQDRLAADHRTVALDRPGYGWSDRPSSIVTPFDQARLVRDVARALGLDRPVIVGFSFGGAVSLAYAQRHPDELRALVLLAAVADPVEGHRVGAAQAALAWPIVGPAMAWLVAPHVAPGAIEGGFGEAFAPRPVDRRAVDRGRRMFARPGCLRASALDWAALASAFPQLASGYGRIRVPVEALAADGDRIVGPSHARHIAEHVPGARVETLANAGHQIPVTHADAVAGAVRRAAARAAAAR